MAKSFDSLVVWQQAHALMLLIHRRIAPMLPSHEKWDLADQIRRSSKSVGANIAEGHGRYYFRDTVRFCYVARGSLTETENHLIAAKDLGYIPPESHQNASDLCGEVQRLLNGYIAYLKRTRPGHDEPGHDVDLHRPIDHSQSPPEQNVSSQRKAPPSRNPGDSDRSS